MKPTNYTITITLNTPGTFPPHGPQNPTTYIPPNKNSEFFLKDTIQYIANPSGIYANFEFVGGLLLFTKDGSREHANPFNTLDTNIVVWNKLESQVFSFNKDALNNDWSYSIIVAMRNRGLIQVFEIDPTMKIVSPS